MGSCWTVSPSLFLFGETVALSSLMLMLERHLSNACSRLIAKGSGTNSKGSEDGPGQAGLVRVRFAVRDVQIIAWHRNVLHYKCVEY